MPETTVERVIRVIVASQHYDAAKAAAITASTTFEELGIDSLDGIQIVFALENEFDVSIPDDAAKSIRGVSDIAEGMEKLMAEKAASGQA